MATFTIQTTATEDAAIQRALTLSNEARARTPGGALPPETADQFVTRFMRLPLARWLAEHLAATQQARSERYDRATIEDKATIDTILARYATPTDPIQTGLTR